MVVLVYRAADGAQAVVAIGKRIGHRELLHSGSARLLDNADICDIMRHKRVKCDFELLGVARSVPLPEAPERSHRERRSQGTCRAE